jgi:hypothetical protein
VRHRRIMTNALIGIAVVVLVLYRQLQPRSVREQSSARFVAVLGVLGGIDVARATQKVSAAAAVEGVVAVAVALVIGAGLGVLRGRTVRLWQEPDGSVWQRGSATTVALWLIALAAHVGIDVAVSGLGGAGSVTGASILLFIAASFGIQREIVRLRARRLAAAPATGAPMPRTGTGTGTGTDPASAARL